MYHNIYKSTTRTPHHHLPSSIVEHSAAITITDAASFSINSAVFTLLSSECHHHHHHMCSETTSIPINTLLCHFIHPHDPTAIAIVLHLHRHHHFITSPLYYILFSIYTVTTLLHFQYFHHCPVSLIPP